jgi:hypothetical protein
LIKTKPLNFIDEGFLIHLLKTPYKAGSRKQDNREQHTKPESNGKSVRNLDASTVINQNTTLLTK